MNRSKWDYVQEQVEAAEARAEAYHQGQSDRAAGIGACPYNDVENIEAWENGYAS